MAKKKPAPKLARTALVVLGMHRSGTSALAGVLSKMGAHLPQDLMAPADQNPKGFFESNRITGLNEELLASADKKWFSYDPIAVDWFASPKAMEFEARALEALDADYGRSHLFVLKDPRICRLLPFWHRILAQAGCCVLHVCIHRHPLEVAASMARVSAYETDYSVQLWLRHVLEAERASRGLPRVFTSYDRLMADAVDVVTHIGTGLGLKWPRAPRMMAVQLGEFLSGDLRNFSAGGKDATQQASLLNWTQHVFDILERWVAQGEDRADYTRLDQIWATVVAAAPAIGPSLWQNQQKRWQLDVLHKKLAEQSAVAQIAGQEAASHAANHATEQRMRGAVETRLADLEKALQVARTEAAAYAGNHETEQRQRGQLESRVAELNQALQAAQAEAAQITTELQQKLANEMDRSRALSERNATFEQDQDSLNERLEELTQERDQLRSVLEQNRAETDDLYKSALVDAHKIADLEAQLDTLRTQYTTLERKSERMSRHLGAMTQQLMGRIASNIDERLKQGKEDALVSVDPKIEVLEHRVLELMREAEAHVFNLATEQQVRAVTEARISEMEAALHTTHLYAQALQEQQASAQQALQAAHHDLDVLRELQGEIELAKQNAEAYNKALLASTSWRITAPLRNVIRKIRRQK
jgi:hypothetical protein